MKRPAYPRYKPSGVEWLGDVPKHWEVKRLRHLTRFAYGDSLAAEDREDGTVGVFGSNGQVGTHIHGNTLAPVIVIGRKGSFGKVNFSEHSVFAIDTTYFIDIRQTDQDLRWLSFLLLSLRLDTISKDSAVPGLAREDAYTNEVAVPTLAEQRTIAAFLDRETGRIDALIAKKRELVERLKEKRTALISHTVTHGLPPDAAAKAGLPVNPPFKPSGLDRLGGIPKHWEVKPVKIVAQIGNGSTPNRDNPGYWEDGDYPWLNSSVVNQETITEAEEYVTPLAMRECHLPKITPPAVLIGITGQGRTRGMASTLLFEATINQHVAYLKPHGTRIDVGFLRRVFDMFSLASHRIDHWRRKKC